MPILSLDAVSKHFGALHVTRRVTLALEKGEALGIIGPNGAGKTTLFNLITGTISPNEGQVFYNGTNVTRLNARQRCQMGIARSFQIPNPFVGLTTFENVLVGVEFGSQTSGRLAASRAVEALEITGLAPKANILAGSLTLLERKRLELARALATNPKLLLLDEIAGGLTEPECHELVESIKSIRLGGVSIIWIEHVVHALLAVVDRIAVIDFGEKIAEGDPHEVMASPQVMEVYLGIDPEESTHV